MTRCSRLVSQSDFYCHMRQTEIMAEPEQFVPRPVWFSMAPVMILSAGSVTECCVILLHCVISIAPLFMCLPLVFIVNTRENCIIMTEVAQILVFSRKTRS